MVFFDKRIFFILSVVAVAFGKSDNDLLDQNNQVTPYFAITSVSCSTFSCGTSNWRNSAFAYNSSHLISVPSYIANGSRCNNILSCNINRPLSLTLTSNGRINTASDELDVNPKFKIQENTLQNYMFIKAPFDGQLTSFFDADPTGLSAYVPNYKDFDTNSLQHLPTTILRCDEYTCTITMMGDLSYQDWGAPVMITNIGKCIGMIAGFGEEQGTLVVLRITSEGLLALNSAAEGTIIKSQSFNKK